MHKVANRREIAARSWAANRAPRASYIGSPRLLLSLSLTIVRTIARGPPASRRAESTRVFRAMPRNTGDEAFKSEYLAPSRLASPRLVSPRLAKSRGESRPGAATRLKKPDADFRMDGKGGGEKAHLR